MNILFVCKHNRFRSKVAEAIFKRYNKNKNIRVQSAATAPDFKLVAPNVKKALKQVGVSKVNQYPRKINKRLIKWADIIIIVADNADVKAKNKKIIRWKIFDTDQSDYKGILRRVKDIKRRVRKLTENKLSYIENI